MEWKKLLNEKRLKPSSRDIVGDARNEVESDFGRIIFCPAIRRMHDKTQVFPLTTNDNIHTRLTHSMEVMSVGYSLGMSICEDEIFLDRVKYFSKEDLIRIIPTILKNSCLMHDIGNPPFGHFGEKIIQTYFEKAFSKSGFNKLKNIRKCDRADFTKFDGNAQGLRVITKLQYLGNLYGLNLTFATLGSFIKYPYTAKDLSRQKNKCKIGVFQTEKEVFERIIEECGLIVDGKIVRHPLSYLMEAADSICYMTMDVEDGFNKGLFDMQYLYYQLEEVRFTDFKSTCDWLSDLRDIKKSSLEDWVKMVNLRVMLIKWLVRLARETFVNNIDMIEQGGFNNELLKDKNGANPLSMVLLNICKEKIFTNRDIVSLELTGHAVLTGLLDYYIEFLIQDNDAYMKRAEQLISQGLIDVAFLENKIERKEGFNKLPVYAKLKLIVDYISGMTDKFALTQYQKLNGQKII